eukprot:TRINITY_DN1208_c0_g1_i21.p1 TRINITY_DN1208_c0_g1~~TRINITY_DN1208_c0_g1_i21.p1  ORF type:complete len:279 (-),score=27.00 TRINITY_DN1208_c0_g1_i21:54-890(-)
MSNTLPQKELKGSVVKYSDDRAKVLSVKEEGVTFISYRDGKHIHLTPESSVHAQKDLGADIIIPLDILLPQHATPKKRIEALHRTHRWEARSLREHIKNPKNQAMYAVIHGGTDEQLRELSLKYLCSLPFSGIAIGGSLGSTKTEMNQVLSFMSPRLPPNLPIHLLGIGDPESIDSVVRFGIDTLDSAFPTRLGRHGTIFVDGGVNLILKRSEYKRDFDKPLVPGCTCPVCKTYSRGYVHHLLKAQEPLAKTLGSIHNLHFMFEKMRVIREMILNDDL